jgi:hypothetical protein
VEAIIWIMLCEIQHDHELTHRRTIRRDNAVQSHSFPALTSAATRIWSSYMHQSVASRVTMAMAGLTNIRWRTRNVTPVRLPPQPRPVYRVWQTSYRRASPKSIG